MKYRWKKYSGQYKILSIILLFAIAFLAIYTFWPKEIERTFQSILLPELSTSGFSKVKNIETNILGNIGIISIKTDCYDLIATVETSQAESVQRGIENIYVARPNAHDIVADAFNSLGIEVLMVKITELKENSFYSKLILRQGNTILSLDARPSDAIAIALRTNSSIYVNSTLLKEVGRKIC
ncbi:MAG: bifunctional nuclease family protein [Candidatus Aenigmatarchaeota archaeon]